MLPNPQFPPDVVTFTEEILNENMQWVDLGLFESSFIICFRKENSSGTFDRILNPLLN